MKDFTKPVTLEIKVSQEDIDAGKVSSCHACPLALATRRAAGIAYGEDAFAGVRLFSLENSHGTIVARAHTPEYVSEVIRRFDRKQGMAPFNFSLQFVPAP